MNEPLRWLEDRHTSVGLREVLRAATEAPVLPAALHAEISAYAAGLASTAALGSAAAGASWAKSSLALLSHSAAAKALLLVSAMGAAGTASYVLVGHERHPAPQVEAQARRIEATKPTRAAATVVAAPTSAESRAPASELLAREPSPKQVAPREPEAAAEPSIPEPRAVAAFDEPSIADEARLLENARAALAVNPARALQIADQHQQLHSDGQLSAERELIAVDALLRLGRRSEAQQRAAPRLEQAPDSLYARRLRKLLDPGKRL
jgi:hypothetical protein